MAVFTPFWTRPLYQTAIPLATGLGIAVFCLSAFSAFDHNDFMYAVAPSFLAEYALYRDLAFVQAPGSIWLYSLIYAISDPADFHLILRLVSLSLLLCAGFLTFRTARSIAGPIPAYLVPIFLITSPNIASIAEEIGNTPLALFFLSAAIHVYFTKSKNNLSALLVGFFVGLSATSKLNFAIYALPFALFFAADSGVTSRETRSYIVGGIIGSGMIWYYLIAAPAQFWFFNIDFHYLTNASRGLSMQATIRKIADLFAIFALYSLPQLALTIATCSRIRQSSAIRPFLKLLILFGVSVASAITPLYAAEQYLAAPAMTLCLLSSLAAAILVCRYKGSAAQFWRIIFSAALLFGLLGCIKLLMASIPVYADNRAGSIVLREIHARIEWVATTYLHATRCRKTALSLSAIPLLGTDFTILPFGSTGPFVPRIAKQLNREKPNFAYLADVNATLTDTEPTALVVGYYPDYAPERTILEYARDADFVAFEVGTLASYHFPRKERDLFLLVRARCLPDITSRRLVGKHASNPILDWSISTIHGPASRKSREVLR